MSAAHGKGQMVQTRDFQKLFLELLMKQSKSVYPIMLQEYLKSPGRFT